MATVKKIEELRQALSEEATTNPVVFIVSKEGNHYLSDGRTIGRVLTEEEEERIRRLRVNIDEPDLKA